MRRPIGDGSPSLPGNLNPRAQRDLLEIIADTARHFGIEQSEISEARLLARCKSIEDKHTRGRIRPEFKTLRTIRFHYEKPWMIVFEAETRRIVRIVHGRRDLACLLR